MKKTEFTPEQTRKQWKFVAGFFKFVFAPIIILILVFIVIGTFVEMPPPSESEVSAKLENDLYSASNEQDFDKTIAQMEALRDSATSDSVRNVLNNLLNSKDQQLESARVYWRQSRINEQFSGYDGRHYNLVSTVKDNMNDPGSFEHVKTQYGIYEKDSNKIVLYMEYRGKNAFGALVKDNITAIADLNGNILELLN